MTIEDYLDSDGGIAIPAGVTLTSFLDRNVADLGDMPSYRYLDFDHDCTVELTWAQLGARLRAVGTRPAAGHPARRPGGDPGSAGRRLRRRVLRRDPGRHHCGAAVRARTPWPRRAARCRAGRCPTDGCLDHDHSGPGGRQFPAHLPARPPTTHDRRRRGARRRRRRVRPRAIEHGRHRLPAVHVRIHPRPRRRGDHPPVGLHQRRADDPVCRPRLGRPQRQLAAAVPRYGAVDDHVPGAARRHRSR